MGILARRIGSHCSDYEGVYPYQVHRNGWFHVFIVSTTSSYMEQYQLSFRPTRLLLEPARVPAEVSPNIEIPHH
jgi:hypothetical protein